MLPAFRAVRSLIPRNIFDYFFLLFNGTANGILTCDKGTTIRHYTQNNKTHKATKAMRNILHTMNKTCNRPWRPIGL
jgi:hypothetical protein